MIVISLITSLSSIAALCTVLPTYQTVRTNNAQLQLSEQSQLHAALIDLGSPEPYTQFSAISILKYVIPDFPSDQPEIIQELCSYIRSNDPAPRIADSEKYTGADDTISAPIRAAIELVRATRVPGDRIDLHNTDLSDADLQGSDLGGANLEGALLGTANLSNAHLNGADLRNANLNHAILDGAILSYAKLDNTYFIRATLDHAVLSHANLRNSKMYQASMRRANLSSAGMILVNAWGSDLRHANLDNANLVDCTLSYARLGYARLKNANLTGCKLYSANLEYANFTGATLVNVWHWHVKSTGAIGFKVESGSVAPPKP